MGKRPPPPIIEGTLKEPINDLTFGILVTMFSVNIGSLLTPHYFAYIVSTVFAFECVLWLLDKPMNRPWKNYEIYEPPTRELKSSLENTGLGGAESNKKSDKKIESGKKERHVTVTTPDTTPESAAKTKPEKSGKDSRFRFRHKKNKESPDTESP